MKKILVITENIAEPIDEGIKKFSYYMARYIAGLSSENLIYSLYPNRDFPEMKCLPKNKLFFSILFFKKIRLFQPNILIYIPSSSSTLMSFIRLGIVSSFVRNSQIIMVSVQERKHNGVSRKLIKYLKPDRLIVLSRKEADYYKNFGINCSVSPIGVETEKFDISKIEKNRLRNKLHLPIDGKIILHVGHINEGRNLGILEVLIAYGFHIVIVSSTRFESDKKLKSELEGKGYLFITSYIENIEEYYQASDIYVFPVESATNAMEFPLSILEAMSCNLPVLSTRFGGIECFLPETKWIKYFCNQTELRNKILTLSENQECENRELVLSKFAWSTVFKDLFENKS